MINIQTIDDNRYAKCCLVRYLHHNPARIRKIDQDFGRELDFKDINFLLKLEMFTKLKKIKRIISALVLLIIKIGRIIQPMSQKILSKEHVYLLLTREDGKRYYVPIKDFNTFMFDHTFHRGRKHFYRYCLHAFSTAEVLKTDGNIFFLN